MDAPPIQEEQLDLGPILVRCACFPVEMVNSMISSGLAEAATSLLDREADLNSAMECHRTEHESGDLRTQLRPRLLNSTDD
jgi:hypothetical protein